MAGRKYQFEPNKEMTNILGELARKRGNLPLSEVIKRGIFILRYLDSMSDEGKMILIYDPKTKTSEHLRMDGSY